MDVMLAGINEMRKLHHDVTDINYIMVEKNKVEIAKYSLK
jgi:hypothetical protein